MSVPNDSPSNINLEQQRKRSKDLLRSHHEGYVEAAVRIAHHLPRARKLAPQAILSAPFTLSEAQFVIAREAGFSSWPNLKRYVEGSAGSETDGGEALLDAALAGNDAVVAAALQRDPSAARRSVYAAAVLADGDAAFHLLDADPALADRPGGRRVWKPLLYLCASRYRKGQLDEARAGIARRLLELGAAPSGRQEGFHSTHGTMLSPDNELLAIEAAAGGAAGPALVRALLSGGTDLQQTTSVLLQAVRGGNLEVLRLLLEALPSDLWWQVGWALLEAIPAGRTDMVRVLAARAELPAERPLMLAIQFGSDAETLELLLGEDVTASRSRRVLQKAYRCAVRFGNRAAVELLRRRGADESEVSPVDLVLGACTTGDRAALPELLPSYSPGLPRNKDHGILPWAIRTGRRQAVRLLLEVGVDPNVPDNDGEAPLHLAVRSGVLETVDELLRAGAVADQPNFDSQTPLELASALTVGDARERITRRLLDAGANPARMRPFLADSELENADRLFESGADAVAAGDLDRLRELLDENPQLVEARSPRPHRATLLHYCGANGVEEERQRTPANAPAIMQLLLDCGADVNATCNLYGSGATTLGLMLTSVHPVSAGLRTALFEVLVNAGAGIDGAPGVAGLSGAAALGRLDLVKGFFGSPTKEQIQAAFMWSCEFGRTSVVEFLLDRGADLRVQNGDGQTPLHLAAFSGWVETVQFLLKRQPPLEIRNNWGGTVLGNVLWAAFNHDPHADYAPIVEALIGAGATVEPGYLPAIEELRRRSR